MKNRTPLKGRVHHHWNQDYVEDEQEHKMELGTHYMENMGTGEDVYNCREKKLRNVIQIRQIHLLLISPIAQSTQVCFTNRTPDLKMQLTHII